MYNIATFISVCFGYLQLYEIEEVFFFWFMVVCYGLKENNHLHRNLWCKVNLILLKPFTTTHVDQKKIYRKNPEFISHLIYVP